MEKKITNDNSTKRRNATPNNLKNYAKYSGIAFQMIFTILLGVFGGFYLDKWLETKPFFIITLIILSVILAMYVAIKDFLKK